MAGVADVLRDELGSDRVVAGEDVNEDLLKDETLPLAGVRPVALVHPESTADVEAIVRIAAAHRVPLTARGSGTGMSGACIPVEGGVLVAFDRMDRIVEIDTENHTATVQPGVTLLELDEALAAHGLVYPVFPGENSASLGGNVNTNAGGMRAVRYGVTRHHVLGLEAVLGTGEVMRTGGKYVKATTGYDLTQLIIGSEGTLALVTEAILKVQPRPAHAATILAPFETLDGVTRAVPRIVQRGVGPTILEYIDMLTMSATCQYVGLDLGIPEEVQQSAMAYLVVMLESMHADRLDEDVEAIGTLLGELGAMDVYVLPPQAGVQLIEAREKSFWVAKANGAQEIVDVVVPRASIPEYLELVRKAAEETGSWVAGCGHAGDGNVHLGVFQPDPDKLHAVMADILRAGDELGGAISGEHGIGRTKRSYFLEIEDPAKLALMRRIKAAFDPEGILNPGVLL